MDQLIISAGVAVASYGPRVLRGNNVEPPVYDEKPEFWGVYELDSDGLWSHVADAPSERAAKRVAEMVATESIDHLDIAYLAIGAADADPGLHMDYHGGQLELINDTVALAPMLARLWREIPDGEYPGVWTYEVSEPLGREYASSLLRGESPDGEAMARVLIEQAMGV